MNICTNCGVELEPDIKVCPLCEEPVTSGPSNDKNRVKAGNEELTRKNHFEARRMSQLQRKATWELVSIILIQLVITTSLINFIINREISWSEYPVAVFLVIFSYVSSFAFLNKRRVIQLVYAFVTASVGIYLLDTFTGGNNWALKLGIPLLFFLNLLVIVLLLVFSGVKRRGINLLAYSFMGAALLCISVEAITDLYITGEIHLVWSLIVTACVIPVASVLLFMHHRMKKGRDLNKLFHI